MKSKFKILLLILACFTLMGCPLGHFHEYKYIGKELPHDDDYSTRIEFNEQTDLLIQVGYYFSRKPRENGLVTNVEINSNFDLKKEEVIKGVTSKVYGKLLRIDTLINQNTLRFRIIFEKRNEKRTLRKIKNDTIIIELANDKKLLFVRPI
ncbi:hypothetical protein [Algibacter sp. 2305UL17-15]|uniref:hypothetical protein n=1 Tax=Algibacter sp. 2305UL17-15 TaxID=3231268 RepID=UPI003459808F